MRRWVQGVFALVQNAYLAFPWTGSIYIGPLKRVCTPGLNCHSCPAAVMACPLGGLQYFLAGVRPALRWGTGQLGFYIVGFLASVGLLTGRFTCGWLCPFGLLQDGLYCIPSRKIRMPSPLRLMRYGILGILLIVVPLWAVTPLGHGEPWYCRLVCPAGTLEAGGLLVVIPELRAQLGTPFLWKLSLLVAVMGWGVATYRPYCRSLCPLGAIYGIFNRWSLLGLEWDAAACENCRACVDGCEVEVDPRKGGADAACLRCYGCVRERCPTGALRIRIGGTRWNLKACDRPSTRA